MFIVLFKVSYIYFFKYKIEEKFNFFDISMCFIYNELFFFYIDIYINRKSKSDREK